MYFYRIFRKFGVKNTICGVCDAVFAYNACTRVLVSTQLFYTHTHTSGALNLNNISHHWPNMRWQKWSVVVLRPEWKNLKFLTYKIFSCFFFLQWFCSFLCKHFSLILLENNFTKCWRDYKIFPFLLRQNHFKVWKPKSLSKWPNERLNFTQINAISVIFILDTKFVSICVCIEG